MTRKEDDDMRLDSGHKNPTIVFDKALMGTGMLWTPDREDAPWMEPTAAAFDRRKAALVGAMQQYLTARYIKGQAVEPSKVAGSILEYMEKQLQG